MIPNNTVTTIIRGIFRSSTYIKIKLYFIKYCLFVPNVLDAFFI